MAFKLKGFSGFGNSPIKKTGKSIVARKSNPKNVYSPPAKVEQKEKETSTLQDLSKNVSKISSHLTKKHNLYKGKKLSLRGQVNMPTISGAWNSGKPKISISKPSANISASYKVNKKASIHGGVNYQKGSSPQYHVGLKLNI